MRSRRCPSWAAFALGGVALVGLIVIVIGLFVLLQPAPPQPAITSFSVSASRLAQGEPLIINWAVANADTVSLTVNGTPVAADAQAQRVQVDTSSLHGLVTVALVGANGPRQTQANETVQVFKPITVTRFPRRSAAVGAVRRPDDHAHLERARRGQRRHHRAGRLHQHALAAVLRRVRQRLGRRHRPQARSP